MGVIKRQGITNTIITYIGVVIGAINVILIQPRYLSEEELGLTRLLYEFSYLIGLAVPLGLPNIIVKYFPFFKDREHRHHGFAGFVVLLFFIGFLISATLLLIFKPWITARYAEESKLFVDYFLWILPFTFIVSAITVTTAYCQSLFKSTFPSFLNDICIRLGITTITVLYYNRWIDFDAYVLAFIGIYAIELIAILVFIILVDCISFKISFKISSRTMLKTMLGFGLLLCVASFASFALRKVDGIILGTLSLGLVAVYTTAVFISAFIEVPLNALDRISHSKIAAGFAAGDLESIQLIYSKSVQYLLLVGGILFIGINACTKYVYELGNLPDSYVKSLDIVYIVAFGALINVSTGVNSAIMFYSKYFVVATVLMITTLVITIVLNLILIPLYGIYGAAIASVAGALIYNLTKYLFILIKLKLQPYTRESAYIFGLTILIAVISHVLPDYFGSSFINMIMKGAITSGLFLLLVYMLKLAPEISDAVLKKLRVKT